jgi:hypothetical protein
LKRRPRIASDALRGIGRMRRSIFGMLVMIQAGMRR